MSLVRKGSAFPINSDEENSKAKQRGDAHTGAHISGGRSLFESSNPRAQMAIK